VSLEKILSALDSVHSSLPREDWYKILAAVKSEMGDGGKDIAEEWSKNSDDYDPKAFAATWNSLSPNGGISIGTLYHYAAERGWKYQEPSLLRDQVDRLKRKQAEEEKARETQTAAQVAQSRWEAANNADPDHAYLMRKQIDPMGIRQEGSNLLLPIQDKDGKLISLQTIAPDGKKLFLKGSTTGGGYMRIKGMDSPVIIAEGYATGVSINQVTDASVAVAFSCHNLMSVAKILREKMPDGDIVIAADSKPVSTLETAREAARAINARLAVPTVDSDFNDMHVAGKDVKAAIEAAAIPVPDGFRFLSLHEIRQNLKGAVYLINPFLERDTVTVLFGESGAYKSFICLDMGLCVAFGIPFHGHKTNQGAVFYVCGEGASGIGRRVESWLIDHKKTSSNAPFYVSVAPGRLIEEGNALEIASIIEAQSKQAPALIIIDTLSTNIGDGDESSNPDIAKLMCNVSIHLRDRFKACVLIVHHVGHNDKDRERGAYALRGNTDARILVKAETGYSCSLHSLKVKDGPIFQPVSFTTRKVVIPGIEDSEGGPVSSLVMESKEYTEDESAGLTAQQQQALAVLEDMHADRQENIKIQGCNPNEARVEAKEWYGRLEKLKVIRKGSSRQAKNKIKSKLVNEGLIQSSGIYVFPAQKEAKNDPEKRQPSVNQSVN
jgi:hypothetical protein